MSLPDMRPGVSVRDQIVPANERLSFVDAVRSVGADSIECAVGEDGSIASLGCGLKDADSVNDVRHRATDAGLRISALLLATDFSGASAEAHVDWAARTTKAAAQLRVPVLRIDPWTAARDLAADAIVDNFIGRMKELLQRTADTGVDLAMENHGQIFNDPQVIDRVLQAIPHPRFGLTLDTGNLYWWGQPVDEVYRLIERYAARAKHTHVKNIAYPPELARRRREIGFEYKQFCCPLPDGNLRLQRVIEILLQNGYARDFCVEDESLFKVPEADRIAVLKRDVDAIRRSMPD